MDNSYEKGYRDVVKTAGLGPARQTVKSLSSGAQDFASGFNNELKAALEAFKNPIYGSLRSVVAPYRATKNLGPDLIKDLPKRLKALPVNEKKLVNEADELYRASSSRLNANNQFSDMSQTEIEDYANNLTSKMESLGTQKYVDEPTAKKWGYAENLGSALGTFTPTLTVGAGTIGAGALGYNSLKDDKNKKPDPSIYEKAKQSIGLGTNNKN